LWSCACPSSGFPQFQATATDDSTPRPAFSVQFNAEPLPGLVRLTATGCSNAAGPCRPGHDSRADAVVRLQVLLALLPGVSVLPQAALTVRESVDAGDAALGVHNADATSGGVSVHAGGSLIGTALRLGSAPGSPAQASASTHDAALAALTPDRLFAAQFGLDRASWRRHGAVQRLDFYADDELTAIVQRSAGILGVSITGEAAALIAARSRGTPRIANRLLRRVRDEVQVAGSSEITLERAAKALAGLQIDDAGLDATDRKLLQMMLDKFDGGPVGVAAMAALLGESPDTLEDVFEPFLLRIGFLDRTPQGRVVTERGRTHLGRGSASLWSGS
jgi:hypothetical protein